MDRVYLLKVQYILVLVDDGEIYIGDNAVIGVGSIVTWDIPAMW